MYFIKNMHRKTVLAFVAPAMIVMVSPRIAWSQSTSSQESVVNCSAIKADLDRLACYDSMAGKVSPQEPTGGNVLQAPTDPISDYGKQDSNDGGIVNKIGRLVGIGGNKDGKKGAIEHFGKPKKEVAVLDADGTAVYQIANIKTFKYIKKRFFMANGQVWEQTTGSNLNFPKNIPLSDLEAHITKGTMGSYKLQLNGDGWKVKVRRVR